MSLRRPDAGRRRHRRCSRATPTTPSAAGSPSSRPVGPSSRPRWSPCSTSTRPDVATDAPRRRRRGRFRRGRADRGVRRRRVRRRTRHALRGRRPARRARRHPRRRRARTGPSRSTPASSCTTSAPTRPCCGSSPSSASPPSPARCRCPPATTRPGWSGPARSGGGPVPDRGATCAGRRTCGCSPRSRASTAPPGRCSRATGTTPRCARSSRTQRLHGVLRPALHGARRRGGVVVRPGRRAGLPGALPVLVPRPPRHARRLRLADVAHGDRRLARVRRPVGALLDDVRLGTKVHVRAARHADGVEVTDGNGRADDLRRRRRRHPSGPGAGDAGRADRGPARGARRDAVLGEHRPAAHRRLGPAPRPARSRVVELPPRRRRPRPGHGHLRPDPPDAAADRDALPRHARRRGPRRPGDR